MAMALAPSLEVREQWSSIADAALWAGVSPELWKSMAKELGDESLTNLMLLGGISDDDYRAAAERIAPAVSPLHKSALNILFNGVKIKLGVPTMILHTLASLPSLPGGSAAAPTTTAVAVQEPVLAAQLLVTKIKLSQVIDQGKDAEVPLLSDQVLTELRNNYVVLLGDAPMDNSEVTDAQLSALYHITSSGLPPYVDFGIWGPHGTRVERRMKFKTRVLDSSGAWVQHEMMGALLRTPCL